VVLSPGIGDRRQVYRFLAPDLAQAGYRVASVDLRGHGDSSLGWPSITRTDVAGDSPESADVDCCVVMMPPWLSSVDPFQLLLLLPIQLDGQDPTCWNQPSQSSM
jgi:pimeloyl-ACP methyl ester carboxylesterase